MLLLTQVTLQIMAYKSCACIRIVPVQVTLAKQRYSLIASAAISLTAESGGSHVGKIG